MKFVWRILSGCVVNLLWDDDLDMLGEYELGGFSDYINYIVMMLFILDN